MGISISTTPTRIAVETTPGGLEYHTRAPKLELRQKQPQINIKTEPLLVMIDQYQCFAESGLKNNADFMSEQAQKGHQSIMAYTGKVARNGDAMAKIGHKANIMINIAKNEAVTKHEFGLGSMPKSRPKTHVTGGTVDIKAEFRNNPGEINGVTGNYSPGKINFNYTATKVDIRVESYGSVDIRYTGNGVDEYI